MTVSSSGMSDILLEFHDSMGIPVIELTTATDGRCVEAVNTAFCQEFSVNNSLCGEQVAQVAERGDTPIKPLPNQPNSGVAELDLVDHGSTVYLRKRLWATNCIFELYHPAGDKLPHHRHIAILHRVFRHNLRNDINTISGWAKVVAEEAGSNPERVAKAAETIAEQADELARISEEAHRLQQLLHTDTEMRAISLTDIVNSVVAECRNRFVDAGVVEVDIPSDITVVGNKKLRFAVDNLVDNALRHNDSETTVRITASDNDRNMATLRIEDDGIGLPQMERKVVEGATSLNQLNHGSGLGLWIVRWVLDMHYATVDVTTKNQVGTTYEIHLHQ